MWVFLQGDSGGPFALLDGRRYFLEGITSYGFGCARPDTPGAYTRVRQYSSWVTENSGGGKSHKWETPTSSYELLIGCHLNLHGLTSITA